MNKLCLVVWTTSVLMGSVTAEKQLPLESPIDDGAISEEGWRLFDDRISLTFGGSARQRFESIEGFAFGAPERSDDSFFIQRLQLHADLQVGDHVKLFVEGISAFGFDRDLPGKVRAADTDNLDFLNAYVELSADLGETAATLRIGRQQFNFGKQRLVSPLPWLNTYNKWDGVSLILGWDDWQAHAFASYFTPVQRYELNEPDSDNQFYGLYATKGKDLDLYYLLHRLTDTREERHTLGARKSGRLEAFDYDVEGAYQFGHTKDGDVGAWMLAAELGYRMESIPFLDRLWLGFDYASGDDSSTDGDVGTFDQMFPLAHAYFGFLDVLGRQNVIDANAGATFQITEAWKARLAAHFFWRADSEDSVYSPARTVLRGPGGEDSRYLGAEIDLSSSYKVNDHLTLSAGYSYFFADSFFEKTGASEDASFVWTQLAWQF